MDINEIARLAGVSRATVSRYLNDGYVSEEKRRLIKKVIDETGYVPSRQAQTLRTGKTKLVGVIIPKISSDSVSRMVAGMTGHFREKGYQIILANTDNDSKVEVEYLRLFTGRNKVDGIILIATVFTAAHIRALESASVPVVVLGQKIEGQSCVYQDDFHAIYQMTLHALENGSRPAYLGVREDDVSAGQERHAGFLAACRELDVKVPPEAVVLGDFSIDSGYSCTEQLLDTYPEVDTIICATDSIAFGAITCLREYGRAIPEDVQVTGLGDGTLSQVVSPALTTVHHFYSDSGLEAAKLLVDAMDSGSAIPRDIRMGYEIRRRCSTR